MRAGPNGNASAGGVDTPFVHAQGMCVAHLCMHERVVATAGVHGHSCIRMAPAHCACANAAANTPVGVARLRVCTCAHTQ